MSRKHLFSLVCQAYEPQKCPTEWCHLSLAKWEYLQVLGTNEIFEEFGKVIPTFAG
jgi:hypothetical protein